MATDYPGAVDTTSKLPNPSASNFTNNPTHAGLHDNENDAIKAIQTKVGIGATTPAANTLLVGTGAGTTAWQGLTSAQLLAILSDETGTGSAVFATTPTLVTPKVDTINEATGGNGTTIGGVNIRSGALNTNNSVVTANITDAAVTSAKLAVGVAVQIVNTVFSAVNSNTVLIPEDDTIPQITEGTEFMTLAITPKSVTNRLFIRVKAIVAQSAATNGVIGALFQDATANALAVNDMYAPAASSFQTLNIEHDMVAGTTSATTFRFRAGPVNAATITFNGFGGARKFGGASLSSISIIEYKG